MHQIRFRLFSLIAACALFPGLPTILSPAAAIAVPAAVAANDTTVGENADQQQAERYLRIVDEEDRLISLEIASRTFSHDDDSKPSIALVSVAHIADRSFYDAVAEKLSAFDIVLYEAVAPAGVRSGQGELREEKIDSAMKAMTFIASFIEQYRATYGEYPADLAALEKHIESQEPIVRNWFLHALTDPWGQRFQYQRTDEAPGYELYSAGPRDVEAEHAANGSEQSPESTRIRFDDHGSVHPMEREDSNLQKQLAEALGLAYQLESLPYESANWLISDMTAEEMFRAFSGTDEDFELFSGTMAGTALPARMVGMMLRFIRVLDAMYDGAISDMVKVLFIEILGDEEIVHASMKQVGVDFAKVLIDKRNQVVIDDVAALLEQRPEVESIAILYGAAHMPDLSKRLTNQLGYAGDDGVWLRAITVDLTESRVDQQQLKQMRSMIRRMMRSTGMGNR